MKVFLVDFADHAVIYEIKFYMGNHARINEINDSVRTNIWYELKRQRITIPYPDSNVADRTSRPVPVPEGHEEAGRFCVASRSSNAFPTTQIQNLSTIASQSFRSWRAR